MNDEKETIQCELCGAYSARIRHVNRTLGKDEEMILVEHISLVLSPKPDTRRLGAASSSGISHTSAWRHDRGRCLHIN
jgi:hypothetical protein